MCNEIMKEEVQEGIAAGENALSSMDALLERPATTWKMGISDRLGRRARPCLGAIEST